MTLGRERAVRTISTVCLLDAGLSILPSHDFASIAEAFGCKGLTVTSRAEPQAALGDRRED